MASTYSDRLRIELMAAGDQSGTWGDTTNINLGTLIEEAIAGVASITMSDANKTLTSNNGITDEARKMILKISGTLTATREVVVPQKEKLYAVDCSSLSGGKVHIKTSAATGVEVSPGFKTAVYCDGTNVVSILPQALNETATTNDVLSYDGSNWVASSATGLAFSTGMIMNWAGNLASPPSGWLVCDGTAVSRTTYASLFTAISTAFGTGDGSTTFNIPDMRDKFVIGAGSTYNQGDTGGSADATLVSHTHTGSGSTGGAGSHYHEHQAAYHNVIKYGSNGVYNNYGGGTPDDAAYLLRTNTVGNHSHSLTSLTLSTEGSSATNANLPPYVGLGYIIRT